MLAVLNSYNRIAVSSKSIYLIILRLYCNIEAMIKCTELAIFLKYKSAAVKGQSVSGIFIRNKSVIRKNF